MTPILILDFDVTIANTLDTVINAMNELAETWA